MEQQTNINCYYLGKLYPLYIELDLSIKKITIQWNGKAFICTSPQEGEIDIAAALQAFYTKAGKKLIEERLKSYQQYIKVKYKSFSIENHPSKWGSCNSKGHLTFHWKLIMFPLNAIDYVVVHELCHLIHMNHDRSFWRLVGKIYPTYKEAMTILGTEKTREM
ncbi:SprT family zinc-dependent metalloprotease [Proteiniborus sp. MB09-C3]|uniref:M48 family metallopeptidase n=1 Tax=Proteiniborus sp. MB09-C3 TaxID=3050072 RepID=UPI002553C100|nr:SprT family zinc-dependent metalloprotease [Proteiniborus sp. MB09-C3]WIV12947.1 SprT family zinc-dependent metalloprotease [Proteiniborus sp. MB09-C3]